VFRHSGAHIWFGAHLTSCLADNWDASSGLKRPGCEVEHSPLSSAELKNGWSYTSSTSYAYFVAITGTNLPSCKFVSLVSVSLITLPYDKITTV
jgi:hypothetical protein